jgi:beta-glucosidase
MPKQRNRQWHPNRSVAVIALAAGLAVAVVARAAAQTVPEAVDRRVDEVFAKLSTDDKLKLLSGIDSFYTRDVPAAGLPRFKMTDGPVGTRNDGPSTAYPAGVLLAATWDPAIAQREGEALGRDARSRGDHVLLGPGVNIYRQAQNGRNFEYAGEDPFLAGRIAARYVRGVQSQGVAACVKHFACNNQETGRMTVDAVVSERALHEIYLPAFEAAIKDGGARTVMASYNRINGSYATANDYLLTTVLRDQWHFDGLVMSDWGAVHDTLGPLTAGLDLEMPGPKFLGPDKVAPLVAQGKVTQQAIDTKVRRLLRVAVQMGWLDRPQKDPSIPADDAANDAVALAVAREGITLLKDDGGLLPLDRSAGRHVAVLGPDADGYVAGGGSSYTKPARPLSLLDGLRDVSPGVTFDLVPFGPEGSGEMSRLAHAATFEGGTLTVTFYAGTRLEGPPLLTRQDATIDFDWKGPPAPQVPHDHFSARWTGKLRPNTTGSVLLAVRSDDGSRVKIDGRTVLDDWSEHQARTETASVDLTAGRTYDLTVEYYQGTGDAVMQFGFEPVPPPLTADARRTVAAADVAVVLVHRAHEREGSDQPYALPATQEDLIAAVSAANPRTVVVLESGGNVAMKGWIDHVPALVDAWFPGQAGGRAIAEVLYGDVNPSGRLPDTFESDWTDSPAHGNYPGTDGKVDYAEGIYVGYRGFDKNRVTPRFPFGFGLSYTTFDMRNLKVTPVGTGDGRTFTATVDVVNTGRRPGSTVAQLYVRPPAGGPVDRPPQELKGFARVTLAPGETKSVTMTLDRRSFAHWDETAHDWQVVPGQYEVSVGRDSRDVCCTAPADWR